MNKASNPYNYYCEFQEVSDCYTGVYAWSMLFCLSPNTSVSVAAVLLEEEAGGKAEAPQESTEEAFQVDAAEKRRYDNTQVTL